ncbi:unnamed protein product [Pleuronectes platessa]|uniref:Uncharacterized protein n=1 Tax=Pleuronectes platessa TaxID=8262 RepID=A0A9N7UV45_PLEPL|nr:unnamed protein product [Pleuronectes platessa]
MEDENSTALQLWTSRLKGRAPSLLMHLPVSKGLEIASVSSSVSCSVPLCAPPPSPLVLWPLTSTPSVLLSTHCVPLKEPRGQSGSSEGENAIASLACLFKAAIMRVARDTPVWKPAHPNPAPEALRTAPWVMGIVYSH